jgi:hypothetical protein
MQFCGASHYIVERLKPHRTFFLSLSVFLFFGCKLNTHTFVSFILFFSLHFVAFAVIPRPECIEIPHQCCQIFVIFFREMKNRTSIVLNLSTWCFYPSIGQNMSLQLNILIIFLIIPTIFYFFLFIVLQHSLWIYESELIIKPHCYKSHVDNFHHSIAREL